MAASIWSLLIPAMEYSQSMGEWAFVPAAVGFWLGILFLLLLDKAVPHLHMNSSRAEGPKSSLQKQALLVMAVTLHNLPEGMAVGVVLALGTAMTVGMMLMGWMPIADAMGVLCGATTNTPALGAAQQTLHDLGQPDAAAALACAVTYPIGTVGVIIVIAIMKRWLAAHDRSTGEEPKKQATVFSFHVKNPAVCGKTLHDVAEQSHIPFVVSRLWRRGETMMPAADTVLEDDDRILVITEKNFVEQLTIYFGQLDATDWNQKGIDWNALDKNLVAQRIVITRPGINGRRIASLHFRERYGVTVTRVKRAGIQLVATPNLILRLGDRINVVGTEEGIAHVSNEVGNVVKSLDDPNLVAIFVGIFLGLILGALPMSIFSVLSLISSITELISSFSISSLI